MVSTDSLPRRWGCPQSPWVRVFSAAGGLRFPKLAANRTSRAGYLHRPGASLWRERESPPSLPEPCLHEFLADILPFILIGFAAQLVDGALGMAFGVISSTLLVSLGVPPATASASVHAVEVFTTGASGISHTLHRNVNWRLFRGIVIPGVIGGILGAYVLCIA